MYLSTTENHRYTYKYGSSHGGLIIYEDDLFASSHHSTDQCCNKLRNAFDLVKNHKFKDIDEEKATQKMIELASMDENIIKTLGNESLKHSKREFDNNEYINNKQYSVNFRK